MHGSSVSYRDVEFLPGQSLAKLGRSDIAEAENLLYEEERTEVADWFAARNWNVTAVTARDLIARSVRTARADSDDATPQSVFVAGHLR